MSGRGVEGERKVSNREADGDPASSLLCIEGGLNVSYPSTGVSR